MKQEQTIDTSCTFDANVRSPRAERSRPTCSRLFSLTSRSGHSCGAELHALSTRRNVCILAAFSSAMVWRRECDEQTSQLTIDDPVAFLLTENDTVSSWAGSDSAHKMGGPVGLGLSAWLWRAIRGYDEHYIAWGHMELELYSRLTFVAEVLPLSRHTDMSIPFNHLAHNKSSLAELARPEDSFPSFLEAPDRLRVSTVNSKTWGLASMNIPETLFNVCRLRPAGDKLNNTA